MKEEKLGDKYGTGIRGIFHNIEPWFWLNRAKLFDWFIRLIMIGLLFFALFGVYKCTRSDIERTKQHEIEWTTGDPTFVKKQDGYYIYRREIEGYKYYLYKHKDKYGHLVNDQYVPVNSCTDEP